MALVVSTGLADKRVPVINTGLMGGIVPVAVLMEGIVPEVATGLMEGIVPDVATGLMEGIVPVVATGLMDGIVPAPLDWGRVAETGIGDV
jgi:hypothetical protein